MPRVLEKAKENCFVSDSIKSTIKIEPDHKQTPVTPCPLGGSPASPDESSSDQFSALEPPAKIFLFWKDNLSAPSNSLKPEKPKVPLL